MNPTTGRVWRLFATLALLLAALPAAAVDPGDLLPVDQAFALEARATARGRVEIEWTIAEGYYLYRHRTSVRETGGGFKSNPLQLPAGKRHVDEFFGEVETYRQRLLAVLTGAAADGTTALTLEVRYQGCADLGICYPPQTRTLQVQLPGTDAPVAGAGSDPATGGGAPRDPGFAALGRALSGARAAAATPLTGTDAAGRAQALPLPPEQAFGFEAIADGGDALLLRFTPAPGYYLYRDRSRFAVAAPDGTRAGAPR